MNNNEELIDEIGEKLNIKKGSSESKTLWRQRIIYSATGLMALASLWDGEENGFVSITHFKNRIEKQIYAYQELYPEIMQSFKVSAEVLSEEIYNIYIMAGFIYHMPNKISAVKETIADAGRNICVRGANLNRNLFMSGLGTYFKKSGIFVSATLKEMFYLPQQTLEEEYEMLTEEIDWRLIETNQQSEYLRLQPPFSKGYWKDSPDIDGTISLLRIRALGEGTYYLYRYERGHCYGKALPQWKVLENGDRRLANVLLSHKGTLPCIKFSESGDIVIVYLGYLLPPLEMSLFKVYSWPVNFLKLPSNFVRVMDKEIFKAVKATLEELGYQFTKE